VDIVFVIARVLFVAIFLASAFGHLLQADAMAQYSGFKGAPGGKVGVILSGVALLIGSASVILGFYGDLGSLLLAVTLLPISFFIHAFWKETDGQSKMVEQVSFNKNISLIGGSLAFFLIFATQAVGGLTLTGPALTF
jgi:putative oxidoreductase